MGAPQVVENRRGSGGGRVGSSNGIGIEWTASSSDLNPHRGNPTIEESRAGEEELSDRREADGLE